MEHDNLLLETLRADIRLIGSYMLDLSRHVINEGISRYPVYVACMEGIDLGKPFFNRRSHQLNWHYHASILEEFVQRQVVEMDKVDAFKRTYGDPEERACIFVYTEEDMGFVFVPYLLDDEEDEGDAI